MSHFYGTIKGARGAATRCGTTRSGLTVIAAGWQGAICVEVFAAADDPSDTYDTTGDRFRVTLMTWKGSGGSPRVLAEGPLDSATAAPLVCDPRHAGDAYSMSPEERRIR